MPARGESRVSIELVWGFAVGVVPDYRSAGGKGEPKKLGSWKPEAGEMQEFSVGWGGILCDCFTEGCRTGAGMGIYISKAFE